MGTEIFKIEEVMTEKMKPKVANPPLKELSEFSAYNTHSLILIAIYRAMRGNQSSTEGSEIVMFCSI